MNAVNAVVSEIGKINLIGNITPDSWYKQVTMPNGKPDLLGVTILADIIDWYKPRLNKESGSYYKMFKGDKLQMWYETWADKYGVTKRQVTDACHRLEQHGLITIEYRTVIIGKTKVNNVTFFEPVTTKILEITNYPLSRQNVTPSHDKTLEAITSEREYTTIPDTATTDTTQPNLKCSSTSLDQNVKTDQATNTALLTNSSKGLAANAAKRPQVITNENAKGIKETVPDVEVLLRAWKFNGKRSVSGKVVGQFIHWLDKLYQAGEKPLIVFRIAKVIEQANQEYKSNPKFSVQYIQEQYSIATKHVLTPQEKEYWEWEARVAAKKEQAQ